MLMNYLYAHFHEESGFAKAAGVSADELHDLFSERLIPTASYVIGTNTRSVSFVSDYRGQETYRFHLKSYVSWIETLRRLSIDTEARAREYFEQRYNLARDTFLSGELGHQLNAAAPDVIAGFDTQRADATWGNFLDGVYGVCTRDGMPETVFLKLACVDFVDHLVAPEQIERTRTRLSLLHSLVDFLDGVEAEFAPHEVAQSSRQRCIIDVKARYLTRPAA